MRLQDVRFVHPMMCDVLWRFVCEVRCSMLCTMYHLLWLRSKKKKSDTECDICMRTGVTCGYRT